MLRYLHLTFFSSLFEPVIDILDPSKYIGIVFEKKDTILVFCYLLRNCFYLQHFY